MTDVFASTITVTATLDADMHAAVWELCQAGFRELEDTAVLDHRHTRSEWDELVNNPGVHKVVITVGGELAAFGLITNDLDAAPTINPDAVRNRFPQQAAARTLYVGIVIVVAEHLQGTGVFYDLTRTMWEIPARVGGVLVFDVCEHNRARLNTDALVPSIAAGFFNAQGSVLDRQTWYAVEFPVP